MGAFLSYTSQPPYLIIDALNIDEQTLIVTGKGGIDILTSRKMFYLIVEDDIWDSVEVRVEGETHTGVSLFITTTDILGNPETWIKKIVVRDVDATVAPVIIGIMAEWRLLNNLYFIMNSEINVHLNVYGII